MKISLFKVGLVAMLFFVVASNVLNYVSIATNVWTEDVSSSLWTACVNPSGTNGVRGKCFLDNPPALIATGTALNCLSLVFIMVAQLALFIPRFRDSFALYFVIGSLFSTLLSLVFSTTGWYFIFVPQYQLLTSNNQFLSFRHGWSFWLMTPSFGSSVIAAVIGSAILGCTCVTNKVEREKEIIRRQVTVRNSTYLPSGVENPNFNTVYYSNDPNDPQVLRL